MSEKRTHVDLGATTPDFHKILESCVGRFERALEACGTKVYAGNRFGLQKDGDSANKYSLLFSRDGGENWEIVLEKQYITELGQMARDATAGAEVISGDAVTLSDLIEAGRKKKFGE